MLYGCKREHLDADISVLILQTAGSILSTDSAITFSAPGLFCLKSGEKKIPGQVRKEHSCLVRPDGRVIYRQLHVTGKFVSHIIS